MPRSRKGRVPWGRIGLVAGAVPLALGAGFWLSLPSAGPLATTNPRSTAVIDARAAEAREHGRSPRRQQRWVPLGHISEWLQMAVIDSEDARFWLHDGVDVVETQLVVSRALEHGHLGRGASTITQQLAKNLWLGEERSLTRKAREYFLARRLEALGKERILELYLNVVEWGEGIYGAEAAARAWFGKPASELRPEESAILAAMLPAPRKRNPHHPSHKLRTRALEVLALYGEYRQLTPDQLSDARARLLALLGTNLARN